MKKEIKEAMQKLVKAVETMGNPSDVVYVGGVEYIKEGDHYTYDLKDQKLHEENVKKFKRNKYR